MMIGGSRASTSRRSSLDAALRGAVVDLDPTSAADGGVSPPAEED